MAVVSRDLNKKSAATRPQSPGVGWRWLVVVTWLLASIALFLIIQRAWGYGERTWVSLRYGSFPTTSITAQVSIGDTVAQPTQVFATNQDGQVTIVLIPGPSDQAPIRLPGPYLVGSDRAWVVPYLELSDADGDGVQDLRVTLRGETLIFLHKENDWRLPTAPERQNVR